MKKVTLPGMTLPVSRIIFGCMTLGDSWSRSEPVTDAARGRAMTAVRLALDEGINFFDHADIYCSGKSEEVFSQLLIESPHLRDQIAIQSKCGIRFGGDPTPYSPGRYDFRRDYIVSSVEGSLKRLQTDYLDILLLHRPDPLVEPDEVAAAFDALHASGKVRHFGLSNHTAAQISLLRASVRQPIIVNQVEVSLLHTYLLDAGIVFNQDNPAGPVQNEGTLEYCREHGIAIQAWSPLAKGAVISGESRTRPETAQAVAAEVAGLAADMKVSPEAIALAWLMRHPAGIQPVVGSRNPERIRAACQADGVELTREDWYRLFIAGRGAALP